MRSGVGKNQPGPRRACQGKNDSCTWQTTVAFLDAESWCAVRCAGPSGAGKSRSGVLRLMESGGSGLVPMDQDRAAPVTVCFWRSAPHARQAVIESCAAIGIIERPYLDRHAWFCVL